MGEFLAGYGDRHAVQPSVAATRRRTKFLKRSMIVLVAVLLLMMIIWPLTQSGKRSMKMNLSAHTAGTSDEIATSMVRPRLHGLDSDGQPYNVTAAKATQQDENTIILEEVEGDIYLKDEGWVNLSAQQGNFQVKGKTLTLNGGVNLLMDNGYEMSTEGVLALLDKKHVSGNSPVTVQGPMGVLKAESFELKQTADIITFHGNVHLRVR